MPDPAAGGAKPLVLPFNRVAIKLSLAASLLVVGALGAMTWLILRQAERAILVACKTRAGAFARLAAEALSTQQDGSPLRSRTEELMREPGVAYASVIDAAGVVRSHSNPSWIGRADRDVAARRKDSGRGRGGAIEVSVPMTAGARILGLVRIGCDERSLSDSLGGSRRDIALIALTAVLSALAGMALFAQWLLQPLGILSRAALSVGLDRLDEAEELLEGVRQSDDIGRLAGAFREMLAGLRERRALRESFGSLAPGKGVKDLRASRRRAGRGGKRLQASILLADLRDFTALSERPAPEGLMAAVYDSLGEMTACVEAHGGTVERVVGDAVLAVFGWPKDCPDHASAALRSALAMQAVLDRLNARSAVRSGPPLRLGAAVATGTVVAGNVGAGKLQRAVIGDPVNLASLIDPLNERLGTRLLASQAAVEAAGQGFLIRDVGEIELRGRPRPERLFEVLSAPPAPSSGVSVAAAPPSSDSSAGGTAETGRRRIRPPGSGLS